MVRAFSRLRVNSIVGVSDPIKPRPYNVIPGINREIEGVLAIERVDLKTPY